MRREDFDVEKRDFLGWHVDTKRSRKSNLSKGHSDVVNESTQMISTSPPQKTLGPSPSCAPNLHSVNALCYPTKTLLAATLDIKRFLKVTAVKLRDFHEYFNWHCSLHVHSHMCGIYLPTLEEVELHHFMGLGLTPEDIGPKLTERRYWSQLLWQLLMDDEIYPTTDVNFLRPHVISTQGCG